jgi:hypothetical protein
VFVSTNPTLSEEWEEDQIVPSIYFPQSCNTPHKPTPHNKHHRTTNTTAQQTPPHNKHHATAQQTPRNHATNTTQQHHNKDYAQ